MRKWSKVLKLFLQIAVILLVAFFIGKILYDNWQKLSQFPWRINYFYLALTLVLHTLSFLILAFSWRKILEYVTNSSVNLKKSAKIFFTSQIIRYIPGNIWSFISLGLQNEKHLKISKSHTILAIIIEITLRMAVGAVISLVVLVEVLHRYSYFYYSILALTILVSAFFLYDQKVLNAVLNFFLRKKGHTFVSKTSFDYKKISYLVLLFTAHWLSFGLGLFFLIEALGIGGISIGKAIGVDIVSWMVGYLSLLTPSGVGVREAVMIVIFRPWIGLAFASVVAILARVVYLFGELINLGFILLWARGEKNSH